jgi:hypothetical protein
MGDEVDLMAHLEMKRKEVAAMQEAANVAKEQALALLRLQRRVAEIDAMAYGGDARAPASGSTQGPIGRSITAPASVAAEVLPKAAAQSCLSEEDRRRFGLDVDDKSGGGVAASLRQAEATTRSPGQGDGPLASVSRTLVGDTQDGREAAEGHVRPGLGEQEGHSPKTPSTSALPRWSSLSVEDRKRFGLDEDSDVRAKLGKPSPAVFPSPAARGQHHAFQHHPDVLWGGAGGSMDSASPAASGAVIPSMSRTIAQLEAVGATKLVADLKESERRLQSLKLRG